MSDNERPPNGDKAKHEYQNQLGDLFLKAGELGGVDATLGLLKDLDRNLVALAKVHAALGDASSLDGDKLKEIRHRALDLLLLFAYLFKDTVGDGKLGKDLAAVQVGVTSIVGDLHEEIDNA